VGVALGVGLGKTPTLPPPLPPEPPPHPASVAATAIIAKGSGYRQWSLASRIVRLLWVALG
jgi:hypothetical protein